MTDNRKLYFPYSWAVLQNAVLGNQPSELTADSYLGQPSPNLNATYDGTMPALFRRSREYITLS